MTTARFAIAVSTAWKPLLLLLGVTGSRAYAELGPDALSIRFGWYRARIPREQIVRVGMTHWDWWRGIGWRSDLRRTIALIGRSGPVAYLGIAPPVPTRLAGIPIQLQNLYITVEDPEAFLAALRGKG